MKKATYRLQKLMAIGAFCVITAKFYKCPIKWLFGMDCPGCGMTRAFKALIWLDIPSAFSYHPLFPAFGMIVLYVFYLIVFPDKKRLPKSVELLTVGISLFAAVFIWFVKTFK